jgi:adenylate cyclase
MRLTLGQLFAWCLFGLAATLAILVAFVLDASRATLDETSGRVRDGAARQVERRVTDFLAEAPARVRQFQEEIVGLVADPRDPAELEPALVALLLSDRDLGEVAFTFGEAAGFDRDGDLLLADAPRGELAAERVAADGGERLFTRHVHREGGRFVADRREFHAGAPLRASAAVREGPASVPDPTADPTFRTPARREFQGQIVPSDLHWLPLDAGSPEAQRRVEVSVQRTIVTAAGAFLGVLRVGRSTEQLDRAADLDLAPPGVADPHRVFLCDGRGRLITRLTPADRLEVSGDDLRVAPATLPPEVAAALASPAFAAIAAGSANVSGRFRLGGADYLTTFRELPETQGWIVAIVVPRAFYLGRLTEIRDRLLAICLAIVLAVVAVGALIVRAVKRAQARIVAASEKMNRFDFAPAPAASPFRDVRGILESLEAAKTAMRALGKYAPVDLVRRLYQAKREPVLGGDEREISIMFTDIVGFTTLSERLAPGDLAAALGRYLDVMARIIQQTTHGTIDKYIGDSIMAMWNAPEAVADHARMACLAAIRCRDAGIELARSPEWGGLPPFETRFGLHEDRALVGHFGAPDRMNYTAIGDAVNIASRLEGLNKHYGTSIIASERVVARAGDRFTFRLLDWVVVKGKSDALKIYELRGEGGADAPRAAAVVAYEAAFAAYLRRDFQAAIALLERQPDDGPSRVLCERCRLLLRDAPPEEGRGVHVFTSK